MVHASGGLRFYFSVACSVECSSLACTAKVKSLKNFGELKRVAVDEPSLLRHLPKIAARVSTRGSSGLDSKKQESPGCFPALSALQNRKCDERD